ncbi:MAG TPA: hypothetical protein QF650_04810 [Vicinamibacterales bacterium]|nr:hypothetical protein [Vicinamibacterales bacterium]
MSCIGGVGREAETDATPSATAMVSAPAQDFLRDHEDPCIRQGYYQSFKPVDVESVQAAYDRDKMQFVEAGVENPWFYHKGHHKVRTLFDELLHELELLDQAGEDSGYPTAFDLRLRQRFLARHWAKKHPAQYADPDSLFETQPEEAQEKKGERGWATLAAEFRDLIVATTDGRDLDNGLLNDAVSRLRETLESVQERHEDRLQQIEKKLTTSLNAILVGAMFVGVLLLFSQ